MVKARVILGPCHGICAHRRGRPMDYGLFTMPSHPPERAPLRRPPVGSPDAALGRRARLQRGVDRRAPHRAVGAAPRARSARGAGAHADQAHAHRPRRVPDAVPPPGRAGQPRGDARPPRAGAAQLRRGGERAAERLGHVQRRRHLGPAPRDDARVARDHPAPVERRAGVRPQGQVLARHQDRHDARHAAGRTSSRSRSRIRRSAWPASARAPTR